MLSKEQGLTVMAICVVYDFFCLQKVSLNLAGIGIIDVLWGCDRVFFYYAICKADNSPPLSLSLSLSLSADGSELTAKVIPPLSLNSHAISEENGSSGCFHCCCHGDEIQSDGRGSKCL